MMALPGRVRGEHGIPLELLSLVNQSLPGAESVPASISCKPDKACFSRAVRSPQKYTVVHTQTCPVLVEEGPGD